MIPSPIERASINENKGEGTQRRIAKAVIEWVSCNVCGIDEDALVPVGVLGSFQGMFDTDRSREQHTLREAVVIINTDNRDSTCDDDYPPCPSYLTRRV